jgi:hypothetical protein
MSNLFSAADLESLEYTVTQNGAKTHRSSGSSLLDFFSRAAAMRSASTESLIDLFSKALEENFTYAVVALFNIRDVRGGLGERRVFRVLFKYLATHYSTQTTMLLEFVPEYGRWDDILTSCKGTPVYDTALSVYANQLQEDYITCLDDNKNKSISLASKWSPSETSKANKVYAIDLMGSMGLTPKQYRKLRVTLNKRLELVETKMCSREWTAIQYSKVPSRASSLYRKAFSKHDTKRYGEYLSSVEKGESKINAGTLYPYDIVHGLRHTSDKTLELQWKSLPNYVPADLGNALAIVDGSGSMTVPISPKSSVTCSDVAQSIALYLSERNTGIFKNQFITFSTRPKFVTLKGTSLSARIKELDKYDEVADTNLEKVFDELLDIAIKHNLTEADMPTKLYILSDMEFNECVQFNGARKSSVTAFESIKAKYAQAGYKMPVVVFWNIHAKTQQSPVKLHETGTVLVSGLSPTIFKMSLSGDINPENAMYDILNGERYEPIRKKITESGRV